MAQVGRASAAAALLAALAAAGAPAQQREKAAPGDRARGKDLFRLHCAGCHGEDGTAATAVGRSLQTTALRDPALLAARTDEQIVQTILKGGPGPGNPGFGRFLSLLDAADLVAWLRGPLPAVEDLFREAAAYTFKRYTIAGGQLNRAEALGGPLPAHERELSVFSVYRGKRSPLGPRLVKPDDHVGLDELPVKGKLGYVVFGPLPGPKGEPGLVALALGADFRVARVLGALGAGNLQSLEAAVVGKGGRDPTSRRAFVFKAAPEQASALTRLYARAVEGAALAAKEEADRHLFDPPEVTSKSRAEPAD